MRMISAAVLLTAIVGGCSPRGPEPGELDLDPFRAIARSAECADLRRRLFVIDDRMVLWDRAGNCPDNGYELTLFGQTPEDVLCTLGDSIAGPQRRCNDETARPLFETIADHLARRDLGFGDEHSVSLVMDDAG